jgi:serine/threonine-protein kinase RsbW
MPAKQSRFAVSPLSIQIADLPPYVVAQWCGPASEGMRECVSEALGELLSREADHVVFDFTRIGATTDAIAPLLARSIAEAMRLGRAVTLVRCPEELFRKLQRAGVTGSLSHAPSLLAATQGLTGESSGSVDLHLRSTPEMLPRLRSVATAIATQARLTEVEAQQLRAAVTEAASNAIRHGSPEGVRNLVRVSFHVDAARLIVDVADQGTGFEPAAVYEPDPAELADHGYGLRMMRHSVDSLEFFRDDRGMVVRMTKLLSAH